MRHKLAQKDGERMTFTGVFVRFGTKKGYRGSEKTVLLQGIKFEDGTPATNHLWFNLTKGFEALDLQAGDVVQFDARVTEYIKGYFGRREILECIPPEPQLDYKLSRPTRMSKIGKTELETTE